MLPRIMRTLELTTGVVIAATVLALGVGERVRTQSSHMYEMRVYTAAPGRLNDVHALFRSAGAELLARHGMQRIFVGTVVQGAASDGERAPDMLIDILVHANRQTAKQAWAALQADAAWQAAWSAAERSGPLLIGAPVSTFMNLADFSPVPSGPPVGGVTDQRRVFELRHYLTSAAGLAYIEDRLRVGMAKILSDSGMTPIAFWTTDDELIYLVVHRSREAAAESWAAFMTPYRAFMAEYAARPNAVAAAPRSAEDNRMLAPTDYSPIR